MFRHEDTLEALNRSLPLDGKLRAIHAAIKKSFDFVDRIAIALYDDKSDVITTYVYSGEKSPLVHYETTLGQAPSLQKIIKEKRPRVVNDLSVFSSGTHPHTLAIKNQGYGASYTAPMMLNGSLAGFIFFNSYDKGCFTEDALTTLDTYAHLISAITANELLTAKTLLAALRTTNEMIHQRDPETGGHLNRMASFCQLIANDLAASGKYDFDDQFVEDVYLFAPMHDIGKIGIPDKILRKRGRLSEKEFDEMKEHTLKGRQIIDAMIKNFDLGSVLNINVLRNIAEYHHEAVDGSGYPHGASGEEIPIEARIIAVADVFDALTNERPYKPAWSNEEAFSALRRMSKDKLDNDCVEALERNTELVERIQASFKG